MSLLKIKPFIIDDTTAADAFVQANAAFNQANAAFAQANTGSSDTWVRTQANNAYDTANSSGSFANGAFDRANAAFLQANNSTDTWVRTQANNAYDKANSGASFANGSFIVANSAASFANGSFDRANSAYDKANSAASFANGAFITANTAYSWGNHASVGYATTTYVGTQISNLVNSAPTTLDTLNELAAALGNDANFSTTIATTLGITNSFANGAFLRANASYNAQNTTADFANGSFLTANASYTAQNTTASFANGAFVAANSGASFANAAFARANAAYAQANTAGGGGITYTASATAPATANVGDQWYLTTTDVLYEYINDGTSNNWVDITSPTMSNNTTVLVNVAKVVGYNLVFGG